MALVDPRATYFAEETQRLANRLPMYHAGRRLRTSNWSKIANDLFGTTLADIEIQHERAIRSHYLSIAHLDEPDLLRVVDLPQSFDLTPPANNRNILRNGSFESRARPDKVGDYWSHTGSVRVEAPAFFGATSVALAPAVNSTASIEQKIERDPWGAGVSRTFSAWYRIASWAGGTIPVSSHGLLVTVTYTSGSTTTSRVAFASHTSDEWRRATLTITPSNSVAYYTVKLETQNSASFNLITPVRVDAVQVEAGQTATPWQPNLNDRPNWFSGLFTTPLLFDAETPIFVTDNIREFWYEAVPTRVTAFQTLTLTSTANRGGGFGRATDYYKDVWNYQWDIDTSTNKIRRIGIDPQDIYASYDLSFFTGTSTGPKFEEDVTGQTYKCVTQYGRWLYVIHQMTSLNGATAVVLSIADYRTPYPSPDHLEVKQSLILPLETGLDYHQVRIRFEDPQHLYVLTPTKEYRLRLYSDYAILDETTLQAFFRERYDSLAVVPVKT